MAIKMSCGCRVVVFVAAAFAITASRASTIPFQPQESQQYVEQQQVEGGDGHHEPGSTYHFQYAVHDPLTGDEKSQNEVGDGHGSVRGTYSLVEPDGSTRVVEYTADDLHGFRAEVKRIAPLAPAAHGHEPFTSLAPAHESDFAAESPAPAVDHQQLLQHYYSQHRYELDPSTHR